MTERLDRVEAILKRTAQRAAELRSTVNSLVQVAEIHKRNHEVAQCNFDVVLAEIRGLRTESQRILEHLFGRQQNE
ncbi:MAG: hypothetical protein KME30_19830 [Iphinoe sp. HA4291-MV1]|jgi:hypothetical protein|nr:hypothetical protein [Iphinoe sp. HA4291-MV1]